jgi:putrescine aminotransferase
MNRYYIHSRQHPSMHSNAVVFKKASACTYTDINDDEYLDGVSGSYNVTIGHGRFEMAQKAYDQILTLDYAKK